ncbi:hypothetical protein KEM52_000596 [Ascosphaera acerosa]|nr:hypothetical protein KEM52_000596 [Ascosphaera acerosa]
MLADTFTWEGLLTVMWVIDCLQRDRRQRRRVKRTERAAAASSSRCAPMEPRCYYVFRHDAHRGNYEAWVALHDHQCFFLGQYNRVEQYEPLTSLLPHMISFSNKGTTANASDVEFWYFTDHYKGGFRECVQTDSGTHACWRHFDCHWDVLPDDHFPEY